METGKPLLTLQRTGARDVLDAQTGSVGRKDSVLRGQVIETPEESLLDREVLNDSFDDKVRLRDGLGGIRRRRDVGKDGSDVGCLFRLGGGVQLASNARKGLGDDLASVLERSVRYICQDLIHIRQSTLSDRGEVGGVYVLTLTPFAAPTCTIPDPINPAPCSLVPPHQLPPYVLHSPACASAEPEGRQDRGGGPGKA